RSGRPRSHTSRRYWGGSSRPRRRGRARGSRVRSPRGDLRGRADRMGWWRGWWSFQVPVVVAVRRGGVAEYVVRIGTELRRCRTHRWASSVEVDGKGDLAHGPGTGVVDGLDHAERLSLGVGVDLVEVFDRCHRDPGGGEQRAPVVDSLRAQAPAEFVVDVLAMLEPSCIGGDAF